MKRIQEVIGEGLAFGRELEWVRPRLLKREYELCWGGEVIATLREVIINFRFSSDENVTYFAQEDAPVIWSGKEWRRIKWFSK